MAHFGLTNQNIALQKPKRYVLRPPLPLHLNGDLEITPHGLDFKGMKLSIQQSKFNVTGGVHGGQGFDLKAEGPVDLKEVNEIAGSQITGVGDLKAWVHGPSSHVLLDFDPDLKEVSYINLLFGSVKGRVEYDDGDFKLRFSNLQAQQKNTDYTLASGMINLDDSQTIDLPFNIERGRIEDIALILDPLVKKISWYPQTLKGEVHGKIHVGGKVDTELLDIAATMDGSDWLWMGEKARHVKMNLGFDHGLYFARNVSLIKTTGEIHGNIEMNVKTNEIKWDGETSGFTLADIDFVDRLEIPARSTIDLKSYGSGTLEHIKSKTECRFSGTEIKGEKLEPTVFNMDMGESTLRATLSIFGDSFQSQLKYSLISRQPSSFKMELRSFDFSPVLLIVNPKLLDDPNLKGNVDGKIQLDFLNGQFELARGEIEIQNYELVKTNFFIRQVDPIVMPIQLGYFHLPSTRFRFKNSEIRIQGEGKKGDVDFGISGGTDLSLAELISSSIVKVEGGFEPEMVVAPRT